MLQHIWKYLVIYYKFSLCTLIDSTVYIFKFLFLNFHCIKHLCYFSWKNVKIIGLDILVVYCFTYIHEVEAKSAFFTVHWIIQNWKEICLKLPNNVKLLLRVNQLGILSYWYKSPDYHCDLYTLKLYSDIQMIQWNL